MTVRQAWKHANCTYWSTRVLHGEASTDRPRRTLKESGVDQSRHYLNRRSPGKSLLDISLEYFDRSGVRGAADGTTFLVVGSNGALQRDPGWLTNLRARPMGEIQVRARQTAVRAEILRNADRDRAWQLVLLRHPFFASYQSAVQRRIYLVPAGADPGRLEAALGMRAPAA